MTQISNPADRVKIRKMLGEISDSFTRISAERDLIKETVKEMSEEFNLPKRTLNKMAKTYYKQSFQNEVADAEEFEELYTAIVEQKNA